MIRNVHVAVDFDEPSEQALVYAHAFAAPFGAHLRVLHVSEGDPEKVSGRLDDWIAHAGVQAESKVIGGRPSETILDYAPSADITIVGTHGRTGLAGLFLGSVAERIVRGSKGMVLVVPLDLERSVPPKNILAAVDFSPASKAAFTVATVLADRFGAHVHAQHIVECIPAVTGTDVLASPARAGTQFESYYEVVARNARPALEAMVEGYPRITTDIRVAHPVEGICHRARDTEADLIVIGTRGRSGLAHFGSVAERTVRQAPCPSLVVHAS